jgi:hypothetical protein
MRGNTIEAHRDVQREPAATWALWVKLLEDQVEMALIEYRKARGVSLGLTFEAVADYPESALDRKLDAILAPVERRGAISAGGALLGPAPDAIHP